MHDLDTAKTLLTVATAMSVTGDSDPDVYGKPKFNSTVLGSDERSHIGEGSENAASDALKLSPIPKDRVQFIGTSGSPFSEQSHFHSLQDSDTKFKKIKHGDETSMSYVGSISSSAETDKENIDVVASESNIFAEKSVQPKSNSTARSHKTNPFDSDIMGSLCATTYSPSLFNNSKRDAQCETPDKSFRWSIGQMADFHPVIIDETESMCQTPDPVEEAQINNALDKFWASQKYVVPSPYCKGSINSEQENSPSLLRGPRALMQKSPLTRQSVEVQTMFTFPPNLDLAALLGHCFQYEKGEVAIFEANLSLNTLRRRLFLDSLSSHTNTENESGGSVAMAIDDTYHENELFGLECPTWYHSNDEITSTRRASFDGAADPNEEVEIDTRMLSPDISPIKN